MDKEIPVTVHQAVRGRHKRPWMSMRKIRTPMEDLTGPQNPAPLHRGPLIHGWEVDSKEDPEQSHRGKHDPTMPRASMYPDRRHWPDVQPNAQPNDECPRARAVEVLLESATFLASTAQ